MCAGNFSVFVAQEYLLKCKWLLTLNVSGKMRQKTCDYSKWENEQVSTALQHFYSLTANMNVTFYILDWRVLLRRFITSYPSVKMWQDEHFTNLYYILSLLSVFHKKNHAYFIFVSLCSFFAKIFWTILRIFIKICTYIRNKILADT